MTKELQESKNFFDESLKQTGITPSLKTHYEDRLFIRYDFLNGTQLFMYEDGECQCHLGEDKKGYFERPDYDSLGKLREACLARLLELLKE